MMWDGIPSILSQIRAGTVRALAVGSRQRSPALPEVPTAIAEGFADFESESWFAVAVLHGTPKPAVRNLRMRFPAPFMPQKFPRAFSQWARGQSAALRRSWSPTSRRTAHCGNVS